MRKQFVVDVFLIVCILVSVLVASLMTVDSLFTTYWGLFFGIEWFLTLIFTVEYVVRISMARQKRSYVLSWYGIIDFLAILPTYLALFIPGAQTGVFIRLLRLIKLLRIVKAFRFFEETKQFLHAFEQSIPRILIFMAGVFVTTILFGGIFYVIEPTVENIPEGVYWAMVTMATVGYGDIVPTTVLGRLLAFVLMFVGYSVIAVPTGVITVELWRSHGKKRILVCPTCNCANENDAHFCKNCGHRF
ncbi:MAG: ion transporter [Candidatus Woesearchaeota archaeon]